MSSLWDIVQCQKRLLCDYRRNIRVNVLLNKANLNFDLAPQTPNLSFRILRCALTNHHQFEPPSAIKNETYVHLKNVELLEIALHNLALP